MSDEMDLVQERVLQAQDAMQAARLARVPVPPPRINAVVHCCDCGELIDPRRVRAMPHAKTCVYCQSLQERRAGPR